MTIIDFTARDLAATPVAFALFALFVVIPGYVLGALTDVFEFRRRSLPARLAVAVCLSVAVVPILTYLNWRFVPAAPWAVCAMSWLGFPLLLVRETRQFRSSVHRPLSRERKTVLALAGGWIVIGALCLIDLQIGHRLYFHLASYDYALRDAFTAAIVHTGVPPRNPFYHPGHAYAMRYHYFWLMLCALVTLLSGGMVTPRIAVIAGTLWAGVALMALVCVYIWFFRRDTTANRDRQMMVAVALLSVTGLDIVPVAITLLLARRIAASSDWWNEVVASWVNSVTWQPHSIAALISGAAGLLILWDSTVQQSNRVRLAGVAICGAAFASAFGLSIYVALVLGVILVGWSVTVALRAALRDAALYCGAAVCAMLLALPFLSDVTAHGSHAADRSPISLTFRRFNLIEAALGSPRTPHWHVVLAEVLALPLNYFLEFGFFFVVAVKQWRKLRKQQRWSEAEIMGALMVGVSVLVCTFLRSNTIANNDLGWRGMLPAQFMLLIWAGRLWESDLFPPHRKWSSAAGVMLILGAIATLYDVTMLRSYPRLSDALSIPRLQWLAPDHNLGERTYALRGTYEALDRTLPASAIVQQNPNTNPEDMFYGLYANRQTVAEGLSCGAVFGGPQPLCAATLAGIEPLFSSSARLSYVQVETICRDYSIDAVVVKDTDSVWRDQDSWIWKAQPAIANGYARAFLCSPPALTAKQ